MVSCQRKLQRSLKSLYYIRGKREFRKYSPNSRFPFQIYSNLMAVAVEQFVPMTLPLTSRI